MRPDASLRMFLGDSFLGACVLHAAYRLFLLVPFVVELHNLTDLVVVWKESQL